jgi:hypothetical protein
MEDGGVELRRAKRRRLTTNAIERQKRIAKAAGVQHKHNQPHRYAKRHALNCGIPGCIHCANPRRVWKEKSLQEKKFDEVFKSMRGTLSDIELDMLDE